MSDEPKEKSFKCITHQNRDKALFTWTIESFSKRCANKESLESCTFTMGDEGEESRWMLKAGFGTTCRNHQNQECVMLYFRGVSDHERKLLVDFTINAVDIEGNFFPLCQTKHRIMANSLGNCFNKDALLERQRKLLPNDSLTVNCVVTVYGCSRATLQGLPKDKTVDSSFTHGILSRDLKNYFSSEFGQHHSDITLMADGQLLPAHKNMLAARSSVFRAMFSNPMLENKSGQVEIQDTKPDVLRQFLAYIYSANIPDLSYAEELLIVADKYNVLSLKDICESHLAKGISVETFSRVLVLSSFHACQDLKRAALDFFLINSMQIMKSKDWRELQSHPDLLNEVLRHLASYHSRDETA